MNGYSLSIEPFQQTTSGRAQTPAGCLNSYPFFTPTPATAKRVARTLSRNALPATCAAEVNDISTKGELARPTGNIHPPDLRPEIPAGISANWLQQPLLKKALARGPALF